MNKAIMLNGLGGGGSELPFSKFDFGEFTGGNKYIYHNLGEKPKGIIVWATTDQYSTDNVVKFCFYYEVGSFTGNVNSLSWVLLQNAENTINCYANNTSGTGIRPEFVDSTHFYVRNETRLKENYKWLAWA